MFDITDNTKGNITDDAKYFITPYPVVWIDFSTFGICQNGFIKKFGILIIYNKEIDDNYRFYTFRNIAGNNRWSFDPIYYFFNPQDLTPDLPIKCTILNKGLVNMEKESSLKLEAKIIFSVIRSFLLLLNCKNITEEKHTPDKDLNKARNKRGKQELFTYKTLKLLLPHNKQNHTLINEPTGEHNRIHFCRGHFKEYTEENKLFGKYVGLWWWQPIVRGQNKNGIVMKDYEVQASV
jgi:hypothetical protein